MRAYVLPVEGAQPILTELTAPEPEADEVLVRVHASSVNPHDLVVSSGAAARYMTYRFPVVLGSDLAGVVESVGADVVDLSPGDRVFGLVRELIAARGSFAEKVAVPREWVHPTPSSVSNSEAGVFGLAALTAVRCVEAIDPAAADVVFVNGAAGGAGSYVLQMLAARGVTTVVTARAGEQTDHVRKLGADGVVDWTVGNLAEQVRQLHHDGVNAIIDLVSRNRAVLGNIADGIIVPGGRVASTGHAADPGQPGSYNLQVTVDQTALSTIADLAGQGLLRAPISRTFDLGAIDQAFSQLSNEVFGKIAVRILDD
ncbi:zinc-binding alcohol dehydrogenase family protein [Nocardia aobensis]|uniref:Zinc-binding alcohol dehydrogenase family protein n=1 Tax=Nocardia aobensis TaxID=257277 RepID=A0ABW6PF61_9NOCA